MGLRKSTISELVDEVVIEIVAVTPQELLNSGLRKSLDAGQENRHRLQDEVVFFETTFRNRSISFQPLGKLVDEDTEQLRTTPGLQAIFTPAEPLFDAPAHITLQFNWRSEVSRRIAIEIYLDWIVERSELSSIIEDYPFFE